MVFERETAVGANTYDIYCQYVNGDGSLDGGNLFVHGTAVNEIRPDVAANLPSSPYLPGVGGE